MANEFDSLNEFLFTYLHQDWDDEYSTWQQAVQDFRHNSSHKAVQAVLAETEELLARGASAASDRLDSWGVGFNGTIEYGSAYAWLAELASELAKP